MTLNVARNTELLMIETTQMRQYLYKHLKIVLFST